MKPSINFFFNFLFFSFLMSSCSTEHTEILSEKSSNIQQVDVQLVNGKLKFANQEDLASFMEETSVDEQKSRIESLTKEGFSSLRPFFDENDDLAIDDFLANKKSRITKKGYLYSLKGDMDEIDLDDEVISDSKFASVLNDQREIYVGDEYYVYTTNGLYFSKIEDEQYLKDYIANLNSKITDKSQLLNKLSCKNYYKNGSGMENRASEVLSISPVEGRVEQVDQKISLYSTCTSTGTGSSGGSSESGTTTPSNDIPLLRPQSFGSCVYSEDSIWQKFFGNRVRCNDYHDSTHRVQTIFWNENYRLWASIGSRVKYQKKRVIGWSESGTAEFVEMGINSVKFTYNHVVPQYNPFTTSHVTFKYKGQTYAMNTGRPISYPANPNPWPFYNKDQEFFTLDIIIDDNVDNYLKLSVNTDLGDLNRATNDLIRAAAKSLPSALNLKNDLDNNKVGVRLIKFSSNKTEMAVSNRISRGKSYTWYRYDLNFLLSFEVDLADGSIALQELAKQFKAKKYDVAEINIYGAALKNGKWKGKRIIGKTD